MIFLIFISLYHLTYVCQMISKLMKFIVAPFYSGGSFFTCNRFTAYMNEADKVEVLK